MHKIKNTRFSGRDAHMNKKEKNAAKEEYCILCHKGTGVDFYTDIKERKYFVNGCGQLCADCYNEIYRR